MALNLGDLHFGVRASTAGLRKAAAGMRSMGRSAQAAATKTDKLNKSLKDSAAAQAQAVARTRVLTSTLKDLGSASVLAVGPLSGIGARIGALGAITSRTNLVMAAFLGTIAGLTFGVVKLTTAILRNSLEFETVEARLKSATGSFILAKMEMASIIAISRELGTDLLATTSEFSKLAAASRGTTLDMEQVRDLFRSVSEATVALRMSADDTKGTFRALQQIMSKGSVQAEELRGQLGERLPGAFNIAAQAMGVTTMELGKMLKAGEVLSDDFLPKFSAQLHKTFALDAKGSTDSLRVSMNRMNTEWALLLKNLDEFTGLGATSAASLNTLSGALQSLNEASSAARMEENTLAWEAIAASWLGITASILTAGAAAPGIIKALLTQPPEDLDLFPGERVVHLTPEVKGPTKLTDKEIANLLKSMKLHQADLDKMQAFVRAIENIKRAAAELAKVNALKLLKMQAADTAVLDAFREKIDLIKRTAAEQKEESILTRLKATAADVAVLDAFRERIEIIKRTAAVKKEEDILTRLKRVASDRAVLEGFLEDIKRIKREATIAREEDILTRLKRVAADTAVLKAFGAAIIKIKREAAIQREEDILTKLKATAADVAVLDAFREKIRLIRRETAAIELKKKFDEARASASAFAGIVSSGFVQGASAGKNFGEVLGDIGRRLAEAIVQALIFRAIMASLNFPGAGVIPTLTSAPAGGHRLTATRAAGGPVQKDQSFIVGERGPELFVPTRNGLIVPNGGSTREGGGDIFIDATGADAGVEIRVMRAIEALRSELGAVSVAAVHEARRRGVR